MSFKQAFEHFRFVNKFVHENEVLGGDLETFGDYRMKLLDDLYPVAGRRVLELGPLEGVHTSLLHDRGAREIVSVEGRVENLFKCCLVKNVFRLDRARYVMADLETASLRPFGTFDFCLCLGVLYHVRNPADLLCRIAEVAPRVFVWTHLAAPHYPEEGDVTLSGVSTRNGEPFSYRGKYCTEWLQDPRAALRETSFWPYEEDLLRMFAHAGYDDVRVLNRSTIYEKELPVVLLYAQRSTV